MTFSFKKWLCAGIDLNDSKIKHLKIIYQTMCHKILWRGEGLLDHQLNWGLEDEAVTFWIK